jgi:tetratricopeptide (TPR) repeat protein
MNLRNPRLVRGEHDRAVADLNQALRLDPTNATAYAWRGIAYRLKGEYDQAITDLERALQLDASITWARKELKLARRRWWGRLFPW